MFSLLCSRRMLATRVLTLLALTLFAWVATVRAEPRPYRYREVGRFINANDAVAVGEATHLGRFHSTSTIEFTATDDPAVLQVQIQNDIYTAADGDELHGKVSGLLNVQTGAGVATVTFTGGTGRFANARGTVAVLAQLLPDGSFEVIGEGTIDY